MNQMNEMKNVMKNVKNAMMKSVKNVMMNVKNVMMKIAFVFVVLFPNFAFAHSSHHEMGFGQGLIHGLSSWNHLFFAFVLACLWRALFRREAHNLLGFTLIFLLTCAEYFTASILMAGFFFVNWFGCKSIRNKHCTK